MTRRAINRRRFLQQSAGIAGAAAGLQFAGVPALLGAQGANEKLGIAVIGCGGQGSGNPGIGARERLVAMVDVDDKRLGDAVKKINDKVPDVKTYYDYRKMFDECHKQID